MARDSEIRVGDLVMVVRGCCPHRSWGVPWKVESLVDAKEPWCVVCGQRFRDCKAADGEFRALVSWLQKIDPPASGDEVSDRVPLTIHLGRTRTTATGKVKKEKV